LSNVAISASIWIRLATNSRHFVKTLQLSLRTIEGHISGILDKKNLSKRFEFDVGKWSG